MIPLTSRWTLREHHEISRSISTSEENDYVVLLKALMVLAVSASRTDNANEEFLKKVEEAYSALRATLAFF